MFSIKLMADRKLEALNYIKYPLREYDFELDDERSVIVDICEIFESTKNIFFIVKGFGDEKWPVDCLVDLPTIIEQLPDILRKIKNNNYNFELDFYEQGIEREISFREYQDYVRLTCISRTEWNPSPENLLMRKENVKQIMIKFYSDFLFYGEALCNRLINHPMLAEWKKI